MFEIKEEQLAAAAGGVQERTIITIDFKLPEEPRMVTLKAYQDGLLQFNKMIYTTLVDTYSMIFTGSSERSLVSVMLDDRLAKHYELNFVTGTYTNI